MVHVFKYLDTMALKEEKTRCGVSFDGNTTLRRNTVTKQAAAPLTDLQKIRRQNVDSGYSTSDGYDKRWSQELAVANGNATNTNTADNNKEWRLEKFRTEMGKIQDGDSPKTDNGNATKWPTTQIHSLVNDKPSGNSTPNLSPVTNNNNVEEYIRPILSIDSSTPKRSMISNGSNNNRFVYPLIFFMKNAHFHLFALYVTFHCVAHSSSITYTFSFHPHSIFFIVFIIIFVKISIVYFLFFPFL